MNSHTHKDIKQLIGWVLTAAVIAGIMVLADIRPEELAVIVSDYGAYAVVFFVLLYAICVFIPFGTTLMTVVAGLVFGVGWGSLITIACAITLSYGPFLTSRYLLHDWFYRTMKHKKIKKVIDAINNNSTLVLFYIRLIPTIPFEIQNYAAGLTHISMRKFFIATVFGISPIILVLNFFGQSLQDVGSSEFYISLGVLLFFMFAPPLAFIIRKYYYHYVSKKV